MINFVNVNQLGIKIKNFDGEIYEEADPRKTARYLQTNQQP